MALLAVRVRSEIKKLPMTVMRFGLSWTYERQVDGCACASLCVVLGPATCSNCDAGKTSTGDRTSCVNCVAGTFSTLGSSAGCESCPFGRYGTAVLVLPLHEITNETTASTIAQAVRMIVESNSSVATFPIVLSRGCKCKTIHHISSQIATTSRRTLTTTGYVRVSL